MIEQIPLISVIVPVYNVREYVGKCLESICKQTYKNLEIIVVDDGSTDGSGVICDEYAAKDSRISIIHQANGGLSAARNAALDVAKGEFVGFVDSDDWIEPEMYECLFKTLFDNNVSISACSYFKDKDGHSEPYASGGEVYTRYGKDAMWELFYNRTYKIFAWNKLYRRNLFEEIRFPVGMYGEDVAVIYRLLAKSGGVSYLKKPLYHYVCRKESITRQSYYNAKVELDYFLVHADRNRFLFTYDKEIWRRTLKYIVRDGVKLIDRTFLDSENKANNERIIEVCQKELSTIDMRKVPFYLGIKGWLVTKHLGVYRNLYMAFRKLFKSKKNFKQS